MAADHDPDPRDDDAGPSHLRPAEDGPDEAKRRERPDAIPPRRDGPGHRQGFTDLEREHEAELPPEKRRDP